MTLAERMVEAAGDAVLEDLLDRNRLGAILDVMPEAEYAVLRTALGRASLTAALALAEAEAGAVLCVVAKPMDHMTALTSTQAQFVTGHNAHRAATLAGRVWP